MVIGACATKPVSAPPSPAVPSASRPAGGDFLRGQAIQLKRPSVVYALPSAKSKAVADVETGTMLLLVDTSPRKTWLFVQDEDGHRGWVPAKFTDFRWESPRAEDKTTAAATEDLEESNDVREVVEESSRGRAQGSVLETGVRKSFSDPHGDWAWMALYTRYLWQNGPLSFGLQGGYDGYLGGQRGGSALPLRLKVRNFDPQRGVAFLVDAGAFFMRHPSEGWSTGVALGMGSSVVYSSGFTHGLRLGLDFVPGTRFGLEWNLGWSF